MKLELDKVAPLKTVTRTSTGNQINRFLSEDAVNAKQERRRLERRWKRSGNEADRLRYRKSCKVTNQLINHSRRPYYADKINNLPEDPIKRWSIVKDLLHTADKDNTGTDEENRAACTAIADFFLDKVRKIQNALNTKLTGTICDPFSFDVLYSGTLLTSLSTVTPVEVLRIISAMTAKSSPVDSVPISVIKACTAVFSELIAYIANRSFAEGFFSDYFKRAQVTPLHKKEELDKNTPANYRPISNLNSISKIIERLALIRLRQHLVD